VISARLRLLGFFGLTTAPRDANIVEAAQSVCAQAEPKQRSPHWAARLAGVITRTTISTARSLALPCAA
jgi:hypothetical protein